MNRPRIVFDANVLISAILFGGKPRKTLELAISGSIDCSLSISILDELRNVLGRKKFGFSQEFCFRIVEELNGICEVVTPSVDVTILHSDPDDNRILECALEAQAEFIISGDPHLLSLGKFRNIKILSPSS